MTQLQTEIEADTNLSQEDKAEALEQVKTLAEAGKNPQEGAMQKAAKTAMNGSTSLCLSVLVVQKLFFHKTQRYQIL
nr:hypothetical protein [Fischerella sp. PCC 9605]